MTTAEKAYIAGFLDGDGCIMLQLVWRKDYILGYQVRASVVFYQKTVHEHHLSWLKEYLHDGYIRQRRDGMSEYTIVGFAAVRRVLNLLLPHLRLKRKHAEIALRVTEKTPGAGGRGYTRELLLELAEDVDRYFALNYSKKRRNTAATLRQFLQTRHIGVPVTTEVSGVRPREQSHV